MKSCGTSFPNCSRKCQINSTKCRKVKVLAEVSGPLQTTGFPEVECTLALLPVNPHFRHSVVTVLVVQSLCVNLLQVVIFKKF